MTFSLDQHFKKAYADIPVFWNNKIDLWYFDQIYLLIAFFVFLFLSCSSNRKIDLYDCRRRLWYNQAINSPKDVVIALDMSGSMTGSHFTIAKLLVQSLIDTLQQVNIPFYLLTFQVRILDNQIKKKRWEQIVFLFCFDSSIIWTVTGF